MKLIIDKDKLDAGLSSVLGLVKARATLPILSCVLVRADADGLALTTSNIDATIHCKIPAKVDKPGAVCVFAKRFAGAVRVAGAEQIEVAADDKNVLALKSGNSAFKIKGLAADEFPLTPKIQGGKSFSMAQAELARALKRTAYAQLSDASRPVLNGVLFQIKGKEGAITLVATDGRRLARYSTGITTDVEGEFILPTEACGEVARMLGDTGEVNITLTESNAAAFAAGITFITKLVDGNFPNCKQVIPSETKESVTLNREEFIAAIQRAKVAVTDKDISVRLDLKKNSLALSSKTEIGDALGEITVNYKGNMAIAFDPDFALEFAQSVDDSEIKLGLIDSLSPMLFTAKDTTAVVMPIRMQ